MAANSKKRSASTHANGPKPKKLHVEKSKKQSEDGLSKKVKRGRPVTLPQEPVESDTASEDEGFEEVPGEPEPELELEDDMQVDDSPAKDPNAARESHKAQRILQEQRRAAKPHATLLIDAKRVWNLARQKNIGAERKPHINELMDIVRGRVKDIVFKHDASRIVQTIVRWGSPKQREEVALELKGTFKELSQNKYSKFLVTKLIRLCPTQRASILFELQGHVMRLLLHREATTVISEAFEIHANAYERSILVRDFYGKETALFASSVKNEDDKERARRGLKEVLEGVSEERRKRVMNATKENIVTIFNNPDKGAITHAVVHRALWEYLTVVNEISDEVEREKLWREMFENCQEVLAEMVHTKDGSRVVRDFIARGTAKDRKQIIKTIKPYVERMCQEETAQTVLFTAVDVIDDTKLVAKSLVADMTAVAPTLWTTSTGRRSLLYLVAPRSRKHFMPSQIVTLAETDAIRATTSKKDEEVRAAEIKRAASEKLLEFIAHHGVPVAKDTGGSLLVTEIMLQTEGDKTAASENLLGLLSTPYTTSDPENPHPVELSHVARMYKTLLQGGHFDQSTKTISPVPTFSASAFASSFMQIVGKDVTLDIAQGSGAFLVAELCERVMKEGSDEDKKLLKSWFGDDIRKKIEKGDTKGKNILLEKVDALRSSV